MHADILVVLDGGLLHRAILSPENDCGEVIEIAHPGDVG